MDFVSMIEVVPLGIENLNELTIDDGTRKRQKLSLSSAGTPDAESNGAIQEEERSNSKKLQHEQNKAKLDALLAQDIINLSQDFDVIRKNLLKTHESAQRLSRLGKPKQIKEYIDSNMDNIKNNIKSLLKDSFSKFNYNGSELLTEFPFCKFYQDAFEQLKPVNSALYPIFNGIRCSFTGNSSDRVRMSRPYTIKALSSNGYPATEIETEFCRQLVSMYGNTPPDQLYSKADSDKILDASVSRLCKSLKALYLKDIEQEDSRKEKTNIARFYVLNHMFKNCGAKIDIDDIFRKSHIHVLNSMKRLLFTKEHYDTIFDDIKHIRLIDAGIADATSIDNERTNNSFSDNSLIVNNFYTNSDYFGTILLFFYNTLFEHIDKGDNNSEMESKIRKKAKFFTSLDRTIKQDSSDLSLLKVGATKIVTEFFESIGPIAEEKFKDIAKLFDTIIAFINKIITVKKQYGLPQLGDEFTIQLDAYWKCFKKTFEDHYAHYLDHKLKLIVKSKDRNKLETGIKKLSRGLEILFQYMNSKSTFIKLYKSQFLQRLLGSFYDSDFALFTNICDCENEMAKRIDTLWKTINVPAESIGAYLKDVRKSRTCFIDFRQATNNYDLSLIGLPDSLEFIPNVYKPFDETLSIESQTHQHLAIPSDIKSNLRDFKKFLKSTLKEREKNLMIGIDSKLVMVVNYAYSRMFIDYTLADGTVCHLTCNFYHGMILSLFDDVDELKEDYIAQNLNLQPALTRRWLNNLKSEKCPILKMTSNTTWIINKDFVLSDKIKKAGNNIVIT